MHGLILATPVPFQQPDEGTLHGRLAAGDFGHRWPGDAELSFEWRLEDGALHLRVEAANRAPGPLPIGLGWHPYFRLLSGDRSQARPRLPARRRVEVNNYDVVLPTGRLLEVGGTAHDFNGPAGRALGNLYLDDCVTGLEGADAEIELLAPGADLKLRLTAAAPPVAAVQVYAPVDQPFVVIEPQFNLPDPFGGEWPPDVDTGMARLRTGASTAYEVRMTAHRANAPSFG